MFFRNLFSTFILVSASLIAKDGHPDNPYDKQQKSISPTSFQSIKTEVSMPKQKAPSTTEASIPAKIISNITVSVIGVGVAPPFAISKAQSYGLAKRAATAEAYRLLAEKIKGVKIEGKDTIENMSVKSTLTKSKVSAMIRNANVTNTTFKDGLCEVTMEININPITF